MNDRSIIFSTFKILDARFLITVSSLPSNLAAKLNDVLHHLNYKCISFRMFYTPSSLHDKFLVFPTFSLFLNSFFFAGKFLCFIYYLCPTNNIPDDSVARSREAKTNCERFRKSLQRNPSRSTEMGA